MMTNHTASQILLMVDASKCEPGRARAPFIMIFSCSTLLSHNLSCAEVGKQDATARIARLKAHTPVSAPPQQNMQV
eukprot:3570242-Rhodomonas_salina.1